MPNAADFSVNNGSAVSKTFTLQSPAAGYGGVAEWYLKEGTIRGVFPYVSALARQTGNNSKLSQLKIRVPSSYTDTVTGLTKVGSALEYNGTVTVPDDFPEALKDDAMAFIKNVVALAAFVAMRRDGAPMV